MMRQRVLPFLFLAPFTAFSEEIGTQAILSQTGCYLVDYHYTETEGLLPEYTRDSRTYDVNQHQTVKEWIYAEDLTGNLRPAEGKARLRLQHILFATTMNGTVIPQSLLKHQVEDWVYDAPALYEFMAPLRWKVTEIAPRLWTRKITNLDDGLRYQCAAEWKGQGASREWNCSNYAPVPGRETRDMGRKDYQTLERSTRLITYGSHWLERQNNIKVRHQGEVRTPIAKEVGKTWYLRLPDNECQVAREFAGARLGFWKILRETWDEVLDLQSDFTERSVPGSVRYLKVFELENQSLAMNFEDAETRSAIKDKLRKIINTFRNHSGATQ